jgi:hypothetical protein
MYLFLLLPEPRLRAAKEANPGAGEMKTKSCITFMDRIRAGVYVCLDFS